MNSPNIIFCKVYLKNVIERVKECGISAETIRSARMGRLSDHFGQKHFEFYLPESKEFKQSLRLEMFADNAYHARAIAWEAILFDFRKDAEDEIFGPKNVIVRDYTIPKMMVKLSSCGNPDFKQNPNVSLSPAEKIQIVTLKEASEACRTYIAKWNLGGGNWSGGQVYKGKKQIAQISYNGRIWDMDDKEIKQE